MFEDIYSVPKSKQPTKKKIKTPRPPKLRVSLMPEPTAFDIVKGVEDIRMLGKLLDLCRSKIRRKKRKARRERKRRNR